MSKNAAVVALLMGLQFWGNSQALVTSTQTAQTYLSAGLNPSVIQLKKNGVKVPKGGHLQGIQAISDSVFVITASSNTSAYYLLARCDKQTNTGQLIDWHKISDSPYRHAGGCQFYDHQLAVGVEDNHKRNSSQIRLISFSSEGTETNNRVIARRNGEVKRATAGAVGFTRVKSGQYLAVVGDWDSEHFDCYLSRTGVDTMFDSVATFGLPEKIKSMAHSYQTIQLFGGANGQLFMVGFCKAGTHNRADLFELKLKNNKAEITYVFQQDFKCKGGAGFRYASGISRTDKHSFVFACSMHTWPTTVVNIFDLGVK